MRRPLGGKKLKDRYTGRAHGGIRPRKRNIHSFPENQTTSNRSSLGHAKVERNQKSTEVAESMLLTSETLREGCDPKCEVEGRR